MDGKGVVFMRNPTEVLKGYMAEKGLTFEHGRLAMAMELLTEIKILEQLPLTDRTIELTAMLQAMLVDQGLIDSAELWYERLDAWRQPKFVELSVRERASGHVAPGRGIAQTRRVHELQQGRRSQDALPTSSQLELLDGGDRETRSG